MRLTVAYLINGIFADDQRVLINIETDEDNQVLFGGLCKDLAMLTTYDVRFAEVYRIEVESDIFKVYAKMEGSIYGTEDDPD